MQLQEVKHLKEGEMGEWTGFGRVLVIKTLSFFDNLVTLRSISTIIMDIYNQRRLQNFNKGNGKI